MEKKDYWKAFEKSGRVEDYLAYKQIKDPLRDREKKDAHYN